MAAADFFHPLTGKIPPPLVEISLPAKSSPMPTFGFRKNVGEFFVAREGEFLPAGGGKKSAGEPKLGEGVNFYFLDPCPPEK